MTLPAGKYNFTVGGDDGYRLKIDGVADEAIWKSAAKAPIGIIHQGKITDKNVCDGFYQ